MTLKTELYPHQSEAVNKLIKLKIGALFMEMGTGKTRVALEMIKRRLDAGKIERVLWLCPCSVKGNLLNDIRKHSDLDELPDVLTICGIETLSSSVRTCSALLELVQTHTTFLIVDESSLIKNHAALRSIHITQIASHCPYRMILNGTPVTKFEADLYSQWNILDWRILGYRSFYAFAANHLEYDKDRPGRIVRALNVDYLARKIAPYTYQCLKSEVYKLPDKHYSERTFFMTAEQSEVYDMVIETLLTDLDDMSDAAIYRLFGALQGVVSGFNIDIDKELKVTRSPLFKAPEDNPRIEALMREVNEIPADEKALIFCTYTQEIKDVEAVLEKHFPGQTVLFYGDVPQKKRQDNIDAFRESKRFMIANKSCGAYGLNLQFCHRLIFYSHDWNWGTRAQAEDRVHRLGQEHDVEITNIKASCSIDAQIIRCLDRKERLSDKFKSQVDKQSAIAFLKGGTDGKDLSEAKRVRGGSKKA